MTCPVCSHPAGADDRFCSNCGTALAGDEADRPDHTRYAPPEVLTKITEARSGSAMRGERRTVTMLFADIQGSTAVAEQLDPEEWAEIMNGAFEHLIAPVYRYEGTLARLQGDAVLAFFGAPIAHEDDPIRAVRAGLEIVERMGPYRAETLEQWGVPIDVRVGINTGLVVVGAVGSDLKVEYTALGDAVNVAARMEQTTEPGTVRVSGNTWALVAGHFDGEELGPIEVKGKMEPVSAVHVLEYRGLGSEPTQRRPLIGRGRELELLEGFRDGLLDGTGSICSVMGEAGVGKSRLLEELRDRTISMYATASSSDAPGDVGWMSSFSQSYDTSVPYSTVRDLLIRWWRLADRSNPFSQVEDIAAEVIPEAQDAAVYLAHVAGLSLPDSAAGLIDKLEPPVLESRARETVVAYVEGEASRRPCIVALEDIHWADSMSLALIDDLMEVTERTPLGLIFSMRPYRDEPTWHTHEVAQRDHPHRYHQLDLTLLEAEETENLLDTLLEGLNVTEETRHRIIERAGGNPLFIEQMAQAIRDHGADGGEVSVPTGLRSLLTARLDRLDDEARLVAQVGSVIGSEFDRSALGSLLGDELDLDRQITALLRREIFVERRGTSGMLGFRHALIQDAAYSTILLRTRRELHGRVATYLANSSPDASQEIAHHFSEAGDNDAAFPHLVAAGEQSSRSMALSDAIRFFTTALDNVPSDADPGIVVRAHDGLGLAYSLIPDLTRSAAAYQSLADYADTAEHPPAKVRALNRLGLTTAMLGGDIPQARRYLEEAHKLASETGDEFGLAEYHMNACVVSGFDGDLGSAVLHDEATARQGESMGVDAIRIEGLSRLATNAVWLMDFDKAEQAVDEAIEAATDAGDEINLALVKVMGLSRLRLRDGDTESALQMLLDSEETLTRYPSFYTPFARSFTGILLYDRGNIEAGISRLAEVRRTAIEQERNFYVAFTSATLARMYASLGIADSLSELRSSALEAVQSPLGNYLASTMWAELGYANLAMGSASAAEDDFASGLAASSATQYWERPRLLIGLALAAIERGKLNEANDHLDQAEEFVSEKDMHLHDGVLGLARAELLLAEGQPEKALDRLRAAGEAARSAGLRPLEVRIIVATARAASAAGETEVARRHVDRATSLAKEIAESVIDQDLRSAVETVWLDPLDQLAAG